MADKLELEIVITGMSKAIADVDKLHEHAQSMMDKLAARGGIGRPGGSGGSGGSGGRGRGGLSDAERQRREDEKQMWRHVREKNREDNKRWAAEEQAHRRTLAYTVQRGKIEENARKQREASWQRMARADQKAEANFLEKRKQQIEAARLQRWDRMGKAASGAAHFSESTAKWAAAGTAGMAAVGVHGTVSGHMLENELANFSRELANIVSPVVRRATGLMRQVNNSARTLTEGEQHGLLNIGIGTASLFAANKIGILKPAMQLGGLAVGSAARALGGMGFAGAARSAPPAALAYLGYETLNFVPHANRMRTNAATENEYTAAGFKLRGTPAEDKYTYSKYLEETKSHWHKTLDDYKKRSSLGLMLSTVGLNPMEGEGIFGFRERGDEAFRRKKTLEDAKEKIDKGKPVVDRRDELQINNTGYGAVGSSADALQEEIIKMGPGDNEKENNNNETWKEILDYIKSIAGVADRFGGIMNPASGIMRVFG